MMSLKELLTNDKRKSDRLGLTLQVFYNLPPQPQWIGPVILDNISGRGLRFQNSAPLKNKTKLNLKIDLLNGHSPIVFQSEVIWTKESKTEKIYHIGVKFLNMAHTDRQRFVHYICENLLTQNLNQQGEIKTR